MNTIVNNAKNPIAILILSHGAGAGMEHPFMEGIATGLSERGITVIRFNFPYMDAGRKSPGSPKQNIKTWLEIVTEITDQYKDLPVFMAGKSYGGRMGSHLLADNTDLPVNGIVYLGFPLHAPGKDSKDRAAHLKEIGIPQLFLQGAKDKLANIDLIREVVADLPKASIVEFEHADHSFKTAKSIGISPDEMFNRLSDEIITWTQNLT